MIRNTIYVLIILSILSFIGFFLQYKGEKSTQRIIKKYDKNFKEADIYNKMAKECKEDSSDLEAEIYYTIYLDSAVHRMLQKDDENE